MKAARQRRRSFRYLIRHAPSSPSFLAAADLADGYLVSSSPGEVKGEEERISRELRLLGFH
jgi:hypothetical protein